MAIALQHPLAGSFSAGDTLGRANRRRLGSAGFGHRDSSAVGLVRGRLLPARQWMLPGFGLAFGRPSFGHTANACRGCRSKKPGFVLLDHDQSGLRPIPRRLHSLFLGRSQADCLRAHARSLLGDDWLSSRRRLCCPTASATRMRLSRKKTWFSKGWLRGLEPPTFGITIRRSNQLSYSHREVRQSGNDPMPHWSNDILEARFGQQLGR